jgi:ABC-2 type transport system permease protein
VVGRLIRLTFAVRRHSPTRKRTAGFALGVLAAAATWVLPALATDAARPDVLRLLLAGWLAGWVVGPVLTTAAPPLRPEFFVLLPLDRGRLGLGLLAATFVGVGAVVTTAGTLALAGSAEPAAIPVAVVAALLFVVAVVAVSRSAYAVLGTAMRTRLGVEVAGVQYGLLLAGLFAGWLMVSPVIRAAPRFLDEGFAGSAVSTVLAAAPPGWPVRAVAAAGAGDWGTALGWLAALAGLAGAAVAVATRLLTPRTASKAARRRVRPVSRLLTAGLGVLPATPFGAVLGKELRTWWRDPWRSLETRSALWFGIFVGVFALLSGHPAAAGLAGVAVALTVALSGANLYGQDGTALWQLVVTGSPRAIRADVRGRQAGLVVALGLPGVLLSAVAIAVTGITTYVLPIAAVLLAALGVGSGVAVLVSVLGIAPGVDPHLRVTATDVGENAFAIQAANWSTLLLVSPTLAAAAGPVLDGRAPTGPETALLLAVALADGSLGAAVGGALAVRRLRRRLPDTFARVRYPGLARQRGARVAEPTPAQ